VSNSSELVGDFTNPILKPEAAEVVKQHGEFSKKKVVYPTPANQCWPGGVPFVFWNLGMQMVQQKDKIAILYANDYAVRYVYMNRKHPEHVTPSWYGDSVGHYEGDTLVIDTVGIKVGPFAMVDMYGTPHTEALHVVERYRLLDYETANESEDRGERENFRLQVSDTGLARNPNYKGPGLLLEFTVEDPGVFTTPWSARITYRRPLGSWPEFVCAETTLDHASDQPSACRQTGFLSHGSVGRSGVVPSVISSRSPARNQAALITLPHRSSRRSQPTTSRLGTVDQRPRSRAPA